MLQHILPVSRAGWAERCARIAALMKDASDAAPDAWILFALVARDLAGDRPLPDMPLARRIAEATVDAFAEG